MDFMTFARTLVRRWYIPVILIGLTLLGTWIFMRWRETKQAVVTVAVLDPVLARPGQIVQAQVGFDNVIKSRTLAQRVADRINDGATADRVANALSVKQQRGLALFTSSPLYAVTARDPNRDRALLLATLAVEEGKVLFSEFNRPAPDEVRAAFQSELDRAREEARQARDRLNQFQAENDAYALPLRLAQQVGVVTQLRLARNTSQPRGTSTETSGTAALREAREELRRLTALEPQFNRYAFDVKVAQDAVSVLEGRVNDLRFAGAGYESALAAAQQQLSSARARLTAAQNLFSDFRSANNISDLSSQILNQSSLVNQLVIANAGNTISAASLQETLAQEELELRRLSGLEQTYNDLNTQLLQNEVKLTVLEQRQLDLIIGQTLPAGAQIKLLDSAKIKSNMLSTLLTWGLATVLAVLVSLSVIYLLAYFEREPLTAESVEKELGVPVLVRVPTARAGRG